MVVYTQIKGKPDRKKFDKYHSDSSGKNKRKSRMKAQGSAGGNRYEDQNLRRTQGIQGSDR